MGRLFMSASPEHLSAVRKLLTSARSIAVLTGAGISAESGIPTFRGSGGLWRNFRPEELATPQAFANNEIDSFDIGPDPNGYALSFNTPNSQIRAAAGPNWRHVTLNSSAHNPA